MNIITAVEVQNEAGAWLHVATCKKWGDAVLIADAVTRHVRAARVYRAIHRHRSGGSVEYVGRMPEGVVEG